MKPTPKAAVAASTAFVVLWIWGQELQGIQVDPNSPMARAHWVASAIVNGLMLLLIIPLVLTAWTLAVLRTTQALRRTGRDPRPSRLAAELGLRAGELASLPDHVLERLEEQVAIDALTGVMRRAAGEACVDRMMARARRRGEELMVAFVDVDGLKRMNDTRGHGAGDALLRGVAEVLKDRLRGQDLVFRYGGDEFVCVLPDCDLAAARGIFAGIQVAARHQGLSISFGLAEMSPHETRESLLERADSELYRGRRQRRAEDPPRWQKYPTAFPG